jgi:hypothetical protein
MSVGEVEYTPRSCHKLSMPKTIEQWLLFKYVDGEFTPLSKPFKKLRQRRHGGNAQSVSAKRLRSV